MGPATVLAAFLVIAWAGFTSARIHRERAWPTVKAHVVHWHEAGVLGRPNPPRVPAEIFVITPQGTEVIRTSRPNPELTYYAECVYTWDGAIHAADLAFREPVESPIEILINPARPSEHLPGPPSYLGPILLIALSGLLMYGGIR